MEFDEEVLSEIRNNLMSPTDIDPILISNLEGVRIRATGFPPFSSINDTGESREDDRCLLTVLFLVSYATVDPPLPPPPMGVPALHPLLVPHPDNQLSSGAFSRFRQLGVTTAGPTTTTSTTIGFNQVNPTGLPAQGNPSSALTFGQPNGSTTTILTGQAALAAHQQIAQQAQRNRTWTEWTSASFEPTNRLYASFQAPLALSSSLAVRHQLAEPLQLAVSPSTFNMSIKSMSIRYPVPSRAITAMAKAEPQRASSSAMAPIRKPGDFCTIKS